jgi:copper transport protein
MLRVRTAAIGAVVAFVVLFVAGVAPAGAHAQLLSTDPMAGAALTEAPQTITLTFSEPVQAPAKAIRVLDADQREFAVRDIRVEGVRLLADLPALDDGGYVVAWRVVSEDSHPIGGAFTFGVGEGAILPNTSEYLAEASASRTVGIAFGVVRALQFASLFVLVGVIVVARLSWPDGFVERGSHRVLLVSGAVAIVTALAGIGLQGANQRGAGIGDAFRASAWREVLDTRFGDAWLLRSGLALVLTLLVVHIGRKRMRALTSPLVNGVGAAAIIGIGLTVIRTGHAATGRWRELSTLTDAIHLGAAALWIGGLVVILLRARRERLRDEPARSFVRWFAQVALGSVVLLAVTGTVQGVRQSGSSISDFVGSSYGRILLAKLVAVLLVVAVASQSRRIVRAAGGIAGRPLVRAVRFELALIAVVVALTAALVDATPARVSASNVGPILTQETIGGHVVEVSIDPARAGPTDLHLTLFEEGNFSTVQARIDEVRAELTEPEQGVGPLSVPLLRAGPAHFISNGLVIPTRGKWDLTITVRVGEFDENQGTISLDIR